MKQGNKLGPIFLVLILLAIILGTRLFHSPKEQQLSQDKSSKNPDSNTSTSSAGVKKTSSSPSPIPADYSLEVHTQPAGNMLTITKVNMPKAGHLVIYSDDNGKVGQLLQEVIPPLWPGTSEDGVFFLRDDLSSGQKYFLVIHSDNPNEPVKNSAGNQVKAEFSVQ